MTQIQFQSEGHTLAGHLYLPAGFQESTQYPAVVVGGTWTSVKEQMAGSYGQQMAEKGYVALAFDPRFFGASEGQPRQYESAEHKVADFKNAIIYLQSLPFVDADRIVGLGICAGAAYLLKTAAEDTRLKAVASVAGWFMNPQSAAYFYGGEEGRSARIEKALAAKKRFALEGITESVPAYDPNDMDAAMFFPVDYYARLERGAIPQWRNNFAVMSWEKWLTFDGIAAASQVEQPLLLIHSEKAFLPDGVRAVGENAPSEMKKTVWLNEFEHTDFYDKPEAIEASTDQIDHFFSQQFNTNNSNTSFMNNAFSKIAQFAAIVALFIASFGFTACNRDTEELITDSFIAGQNNVSFRSEGANLVGHLYLPQGYNATTAAQSPLPAIIVSGPWTQVKEQVGAAYGQRLADQGFAVLAFDHRYWGQSEGQPRFLESATAKAADIRNAVTFLQTLVSVDDNKIGALGVCAGVGNISLAAAADSRIRSLATISPWVQHPTTTPFFYGGEAGVAARIALSNQAQSTFNSTGTMPVVDAYNPNDPAAAMFFPVDYYGNPSRGAIQQWTNRFAVASWREWMELNTIDMARNIRVPMAIIYGDQTFLQDNITAFYNLLPGQKTIERITGEHTEFYDLSGAGQVNQSLEKVGTHFKNTLK